MGVLDMLLWALNQVRTRFKLVSGKNIKAGLLHIEISKLKAEYLRLTKFTTQHKPAWLVIPGHYISDTLSWILYLGHY